MKLNQIKVIIVAIMTPFGILTNLNFARSATILLENPGFETPKQTNEPVPGAGFFDFTTPPGWSLYDPNNLIPENATLGTPFTGGWQPSDSFFPDIPEGAQIGSIFLVPPGLGEVGFVQSSGILIEPKTEYILSVAVLNTPSVEGSEFFAGFPGYRLELLAGNTVISADNNSVAINEGEFERVSISYSSLNDSIYLGEELGIRLVNLNLNNSSGLNNGNGIEVNFDDVRLNATSVDRTTAVPESNFILGLLLTTSLFLRRLKNHLAK
jgi:hapalindole H/12-epi-hapalindole U/12-epi-fischerindole U synthase